MNVYNRKVALLAIYRPGSSPPTPLFFKELLSVLEHVSSIAPDILLSGDFNIHVERENDPNTISLLELLKLFDLACCINEPTHELGGTLDLIVSSSGLPVIDCKVYPAGVYSDHSFIKTQLAIKCQPSIKKRKLVRSWKKLDHSLFTSLLLNSAVSKPCAANDVVEALALFEREIKVIVDTVAPLHFVESRCVPLAPWFDDECKKCKQICRKLERKFRDSPCEVNKNAWKLMLKNKSKLYVGKKVNYWNTLVESNLRCPKQLWSVINKIISKSSPNSLEDIVPGFTPEFFADFFKDKIIKTRVDSNDEYSQLFPHNVFEGLPLSVFSNCTESEIKNIILASPNKFCLLDCIPTFILKKFIDLFLPFVTSLVNLSLSTGHMPLTMKHAIVVPLLKDDKLDKNIVENYRPVSNLSFLSKLIERVVMNQLLHYLTINNLWPLYQSGFRKFHSTETALLQVCSDLYAAMDTQCVSLLALLDMSAAFDCVDHNLLLEKLSSNYGLSNVVVSWFKSYLLGRTQQIFYNGRLSQIQPVLFGVPQGSVLGPILFLLYTAEIFSVVEQCGFKAHAYADDLQIMASSPATGFNMLTDNFVKCLSLIDTFMSAHHLRLNQCKTKLIPIGTWQQTSRLTTNSVSVNALEIPFCQVAKNLGFYFDLHLTMQEHIKTLTSSCSYQLRRLRFIRRFLNRTSLESLVHAFVHSRLDYCNSLFYGISSNLVFKLQSIQNQAAKLVDGGLKFDHVGPILKKLHWLKVDKRIIFRIAILVFRCLKSQAPKYLIDKCVPKNLHDVNYRLRSSDMNLLIVPNAQLVIGSRNFAVAGPIVWNSLPHHLRCPDLSFERFRKELKSYLFTL